MSRLDGLIAELCPDGVPFREIGAVVKLNFGTRITKLKDSGSLYPVYGGGGESFRTDSFNREDAYVVSRFAMSERCVRKVQGKFWMLDSGFTFDPTDPLVDRDFVGYVLLSMQRAIYACSTQGAQKNLKTSEFLKFRIPTPPLTVQREIVRILDQFTNLETQLTAELNARKQQRLGLARTLVGAPYSRAPGADLNESVTLGDVATQYVAPLRVRADEKYKSLGVKWYGAGAFERKSRFGSAIKGTTLYGVKQGQLIYNRMFVTEGSFGIVTPGQADGVVSNEFPVFDLDSSRILPEWLVLYFQDEYTLKRIAREVTGTERGSTKSRRRWKEDQFRAFQVELPPIAAQREFLRVIGTVAGLESALSDEIVARRRQYQHYRDRLMDFEEIPA